MQKLYMHLATQMDTDRQENNARQTDRQAQTDGLIKLKARQLNGQTDRLQEEDRQTQTKTDREADKNSKDASDYNVSSLGEREQQPLCPQGEVNIGMLMLSLALAGLLALPLAWSLSPSRLLFLAHLLSLSLFLKRERERDVPHSDRES